MSLGNSGTANALMEVSNNDELLEIARKAIEDALIEFRDDRMFVLRNNGLVIKEYDGTDSHIIRFGSETAMRIGMTAIAKYLVK